MSGVGYIKCHIPDKRISVKEYFENYIQNYNEGEEKYKTFVRDTGLENIAIEKIDIIESLSILIQEYIDTVKPDLNQIKYIFFTDMKNVKDDDGKYIPYHLQGKFGFKNANVIVVNQYCSGSIFAMGMASKMIEKDEIALILSSSKIKDMKDRYIGYTIQGDASGIVEIKNDEYSYEIKEFNYTTKLGSENAEDNDIKDRLQIVRKGVTTINELIKKANIQKDKVDFLIPQNVSETAYTIVYSSLLGIDKDKIFLENIKIGGHLCDVDALFNLKTCIEKNPSSKNLILYGLGEVGDNFCINTVLLQKK